MPGSRRDTIEAQCADLDIEHRLSKLIVFLSGFAGHDQRKFVLPRVKIFSRGQVTRSAAITSSNSSLLRIERFLQL